MSTGLSSTLFFHSWFSLHWPRSLVETALSKNTTEQKVWLTLHGDRWLTSSQQIWLKLMGNWDFFFLFPSRTFLSWVWHLTRHFFHSCGENIAIIKCHSLIVIALKLNVSTEINSSICSWQDVTATACERDVCSRHSRLVPLPDGPIFQKWLCKPFKSSCQ